MEYKNILYNVSDNIAVLKLNRPEALNALNQEINTEILDALKTAMQDEDVRALIVTGSARAFAAGADVKEMADANPRFARDFCGLAIEINDMLENMPIPTIAAIPGFAFGGGLEMALACDFRIGGPGTRLGFPEVGLGIIPGANGCARATALLGPAKAKQLVMLTETLKGQEAYDLGLLNWIVETDPSITDKKESSQAEYERILAKALEIAASLVSKPACALAAAKAAINKASSETVMDGKARETTEFTLLFDTEDQKEGMAAMIEKRKPEFKNR